MKVLIAGMGLIGGSFALALRDRGIADEILGVESSEGNAAEALRLGLADRIVAFEEGIPQADLVVLATPVDTIPLMAVKALNRVNGSQVVMDLGSIKAELCEVISMHARRGRFVAVHPMWGTEYSGPRAAQHGAFTGRNVVLCEVERSDPDALAMAERPASATTCASSWCCLALRTLCLMPRSLSMRLSNSEISTEVVPTSTGRPASTSFTISSITALYFSRLVL